MPWLYTLLGALLALGLSIVPRAGLDTALEFLPSIVDQLQVGGLLSAIWPWFFCGRAAARLLGWRRSALAGTLLASALATVGLGSILMDVMLPRHVMLLASSGAASSALLWWVCDRLRERGALGGTMTVMGGVLLLDLPRLAMGHGASLATDPSILLFVLGAAALLSPAALGVALWRRLPERPPPWLPVKHPLELMLLPLAVGELVSGLRAPGLPYVLDSLAMLGAVALVLWLTRARTQGPPMLAGAGVVEGLVVLGSLCWGIHATSDILGARYVEGPVDGSHSVRVLCTAPGADLAEIERMRARMDELRIEGNVQLLDGLVQLELLDVAEPTELMDTLTAPSRFEIRPENVGDPVLSVAQCPGCEVIDLGEVVLTNSHIAKATMNIGYAGAPGVALEFTPDGEATFAALTTQTVGSRIALMVDGQVLSAPYVMEPITGGKAWLTLDGASVEDAQVIATLLSLEPLEATWIARDFQEITP